MADKRAVEVVLQGRRFQLRTAVEDESLADIVAMANAKIDEIAAAAPLPPHPAALLAVLTLSEELYNERRDLAALRERIRSKSALLLDMLDAAGRPEPGEVPGDDPPVGGMSI
ncbi:MAG: cell division protein ZapA [Deltaproteobacteria bacterium]|nr:cell division protein ZapA [Deltaproteobacteria bacterium]